MAYRHDADLAFLGELSNENLGKLIKGNIYNVENCIPKSFFDYSPKIKKTSNNSRLYN